MYMWCCALDYHADAKLNGFDKKSPQHGRQTTERVEVHHQPLTLSSTSSSLTGPSEIAVNHHEPPQCDGIDHNMNVVLHSSGPGLDSELDTKCEPEPDSNGDTLFPSPPALVLNSGVGISIGISTAAEQDSSTVGIPGVVEQDGSSTTDDVSVTHSVAESEPTTSLNAESENPSNDAMPVPPSSSSSSSSTPLPPPPPPLPTSFNTVIPPALKPSGALPHPSERGSVAGVRRTSAAQLEEQRRQDASHAALLAAVARRRSLLDTTDAEQLAKSIESRVRRNSKIQMVFRANPSDQHRSFMPPAGLLVQSGKHEDPLPESPDSPENTDPPKRMDTLENMDAPEIMDTVENTAAHVDTPENVNAPESTDMPQNTDTTVVENGKYFLSCC